jgi:hypothetical protein
MLWYILTEEVGDLLDKRAFIIDADTLDEARNRLERMRFAGELPITEVECPLKDVINDVQDGILELEYEI